MTILIYIFCVFLFLFLFIVPKNKEKLRPLKKYLFNKFTLNENSLHEQGLFWFAILFPLYSSLCFIFLLGWDYPFKWDAIGFNNFLNIHKFSLGILALSPILGAFVVSAHRSIQTAKQIEVTEKKNKVDIYISTRKYNYELIGFIKDKHNRKIKHVDSLYNIAFKNQIPYQNDINEYFYIGLDNSFKKINSSLIELIDIHLNKGLYLNRDFFDSNKLHDFVDSATSIICVIEKIERDIFLERDGINRYNLLNEFHENVEKENKKSYLLTIRLICNEILNLIQFIYRIVEILLPEKDPQKHLPNLQNLKKTLDSLLKEKIITHADWRQSGDRKPERP